MVSGLAAGHLAGSRRQPVSGNCPLPCQESRVARFSRVANPLAGGPCGRLREGASMLAIQGERPGWSSDVPVHALDSSAMICATRHSAQPGPTSAKSREHTTAMASTTAGFTGRVSAIRPLVATRPQDSPFRLIPSQREAPGMRLRVDWSRPYPQPANEPGQPATCGASVLREWSVGVEMSSIAGVAQPQAGWHLGKRHNYGLAIDRWARQETG
jgi:hypothetical protein